MQDAGYNLSPAIPSLCGRDSGQSCASNPYMARSIVASGRRLCHPEIVRNESSRKRANLCRRSGKPGSQSPCDILPPSRSLVMSDSVPCGRLRYCTPVRSSRPATSRNFQLAGTRGPRMSERVARSLKQPFQRNDTVYRPSRTLQFADPLRHGFLDLLARLVEPQTVGHRCNSRSENYAAASPPIHQPQHAVGLRGDGRVVRDHDYSELVLARSSYAAAPGCRGRSPCRGCRSARRPAALAAD